MAAPRVMRPGFAPGYGITESPEGLLPWQRASERLAGSRNYWISTVGPNGRPHAAPVWGVWLDETLYFGTSGTSRKGKNLAERREIVVHLESGDDVVLIEGRVEDFALDDPVADAYEAKYDYRPQTPASEGEAWYALRPSTGYAWLEQEFTSSATRYEWS